MRRILALLLASLLTAPLAVAGDADDLAATVAAMGRIGRSFGASFSPDGRQVAFISDLSGTPQVWIVPSSGGFPRLVTAGNDPATAVRWSPTSDWLAVAIAPGGGLNAQIYIIRPDGTGMKRLTDGGKENNFLGDWTTDGRYLTMSSNRRNPAGADSYLLDPLTGVMRLVAENKGLGFISSLSDDGKRALLSRLENRGDDNLYLLDLAAGKETLLTPHQPPAQFGGELSREGRTVYLVSNDKRDLMAFGRMRLGADGTPGAFEILAERADAEVDNFEINEQETLALVQWNVGGRTEISFVELPGGKQRPGPKLPTDLAGGFTFSKDGKLLAATFSGSAAPVDIWTYDLAAQKFSQLTYSPHPGVDLKALARPELVKYKAHDGLELSGWLYLPKNYSKPGPIVLSFHGGPEGQERPAFRSDYQALLSQGIAVFAPNVRGSSGFGKKFVNLDNGAKRVDGVRDIKSTVEYVVQAGLADARRVGITGGSYGGYMTMAGLTEFPELFAAGVNLFGIFNFETFFSHTEPWMAAISTIEYGNPQTEAEMLRSLSPIHKVERITAPTMVQHGANDTNVPVVEAEQVVDMLKKRGVPVEYVLFPDEGHGWRKIPNRIKSTVDMTRFFAQHLKAAAATKAAE